MLYAVKRAVFYIKIPIFGDPSPRRPAGRDYGASPQTPTAALKEKDKEENRDGKRGSEK